MCKGTEQGQERPRLALCLIILCLVKLKQGVWSERESTTAGQVVCIALHYCCCWCVLPRRGMGAVKCCFEI